MFHRFRRPRKRWLLAGVLALILVPSAVAAGWVIFGGGHGTGTVTWTSGTPGAADAVTFTPAAGSAAIDPGVGTYQDLKLLVTNNSNVSEVVNTLTATITDTSQPSCTAYVAIQPPGNFNPITVPASANNSPITVTGFYRAFNGAPAICSSATNASGVTFTLTATTTP